MYRVKCFDLHLVGAADRRAALRAQVLAWTPFDDCEYRIALNALGAVAVAWDRTVVAGLTAAASINARAVFIPELWARPPAKANGVRVIDAIEGVEAQYWQGGVLRASRWWPQQPDAEAAQSWLRSLGHDARGIDTLPEATRPAWVGAATASLLTLDDLQSTTSRLERTAVGVAGLVLIAFTAAQAHRLYAVQAQLHSTQTSLDRARLDAGPLLAARDRALALSAQAQALASLVIGVAPLDVLQHLADVLPPTGAVLREFDLTGTRLRIALELAPQVSRSAVVRDMQAGAWFTRVTEASDNGNRGWTWFDVELAGRQPPLGAAPRSAATQAPPSAAVLPTLEPRRADTAPTTGRAP